MAHPPTHLRPAPVDAPGSIVRGRIVDAAAALLAAGGREAVTTRSVSAAAGVQSPAIYRLFGDMRGLLDAVAERGFAAYLRGKTALPVTGEPVDALRRGWDLHIGFGLENPALYALMYGDPRSDATPSPAAVAARRVLEGLVTAVARAGRLRVGVPQAMAISHAAGVGVVLTLIATSPAERDPTLSVATREAILAAITTGPVSSSDHPDGGDLPATERVEDGAGRLRRHAVAFRADLTPAVGTLTHGERTVLTEWLDRIIDPADARGVPPSGH